MARGESVTTYLTRVSQVRDELRVKESAVRATQIPRRSTVSMA